MRRFIKQVCDKQYKITITKQMFQISNEEGFQDENGNILESLWEIYNVESKVSLVFANRQHAEQSFGNY